MKKFDFDHSPRSAAAAQSSHDGQAALAPAGASCWVANSGNVTVEAAAERVDPDLATDPTAMINDGGRRSEP